MIYQIRKAYGGGWRAGANTIATEDTPCPYHPILNFVLFVAWNTGLHDGCVHALSTMLIKPWFNILKPGRK